MNAELRKEVTASQFFAIAFGAIVGVGWIVVLGSWLGDAGPLGAALAFVAGGIVMVLVGFCYAEMAARYPVSGGEVAYAHEVFGVGTAYTVGWALILMNTSAVAYVSISMAWIIDVLVPGLQGPALYTFRGGVVHAGSTAIALAATSALTYLNYRGVRSAAALQNWLTYGKLIVALIFISAGFLVGSTQNLQPLFNLDAKGSALSGMLAVFVTTPWWLGGFNTVAQVMEEKSPGTSLRTAVRVMVLAIFVAAVFYALVIISASMAVPWQSLVDADLAAAAAFRQAFGSEWMARVVLFAGLLGIITVGNATSLAASRLLFALSRASIIPPMFARIHPVHGSPGRAVIFVGAVASLGVALGRSGILPVVNIGAACLALAYVVTVTAVLRLRARGSNAARPYSVPGGAWTAGLAFAASAFLLVVSIYQPYADGDGGLPLEWLVLIGWSVLGLGLWLAALRVRGGVSPEERRAIILGGAPSSAEPS